MPCPLLLAACFAPPCSGDRLTAYNDLFERLVAAPLRRIVGSPLRAALYFIIRGEFDPETPNESGGCQGVHLIFDGGEVEFDWDFRSAFVGGDSGFAYHLTVSDHSIRSAGVREWTTDDISGLNLVPASDTRTWKNLVGQPLAAVEVLCVPLDATRISPQAVRLRFPSASVVIAIGMTQETGPPVVGDGDEILIFDDDAWAAVAGPGEVAALAHFPCSKAARSLTAQGYTMDGGWSQI